MKSEYPELNTCFKQIIYIIHMKLLNIVISPAWVHQFLSCTRDYEGFHPIKLRLRQKIIIETQSSLSGHVSAQLAVLVMFILSPTDVSGWMFSDLFCYRWRNIQQSAAGEAIWRV